MKLDYDKKKMNKDIKEKLGFICEENMDKKVDMPVLYVYVANYTGHYLETINLKKEKCNVSGYSSSLHELQINSYDGRKYKDVVDFAKEVFLRTYDRSGRFKDKEINEIEKNIKEVIDVGLAYTPKCKYFVENIEKAYKYNLAYFCYEDKCTAVCVVLCPSEIKDEVKKGCFA